MDKTNNPADMTILSAIRTLREERDIGFDQAVYLAVKHFENTNRYVPEFLSLKAKRYISQ